MKKIILSAALTAVLASPAFSQATPMLTEPLTPAYSSQRVQPGHFAQRGYVQQQGYAAGVVAEGGRIVGQDPGPNVQLELRRDPVADY